MISCVKLVNVDRNDQASRAVSQPDGADTKSFLTATH